MGITLAQAFETFQDDPCSMADYDSAADDNAVGSAAAAGSAATASSAAAGSAAATGSTAARSGAGNLYDAADGFQYRLPIRCIPERCIPDFGSQRR